MRLTDFDFLHSTENWRQSGRAIGRALAGVKNPLALDLGSFSSPFREKIWSMGARLISFDISRDGGRLPDVVGFGEELPFASDSFDMVLCTQVLEHVSDPWLVVSEARRVLKPRGVLLLSTHGIWIRHGCPNDNWRFTSDGLLALAENFSKADVFRQGNNFVGLMQCLNLAIKSRRRPAFLPWRVFRALKSAAYVLPNILGRLLSGGKSRGLAQNYLLVAKK